MNDEKFVAAIRREVIDSDLPSYEAMFEKTTLDSRSDDYWGNAWRFYRTLDAHGKQVLFSIMRQVMVDTISNLFGILDGTSQLAGEMHDDFILLHGDEKLNGCLQDWFLGMEEDEKSTDV